MSVFFISDLHLDDKTTPLVKSLGTLIDQIITEKASALYILGDFFEAWVGDDFQAHWLDEIITILKRLTDSKVSLYFMHGNRDFLVGSEFCDQINATLIHEPYHIDLFGTPTLLMHGDSLCTSDLEYQAFKAQVRSKIWQEAFLSKPLEERLIIAQQVRAESKASSTNKAPEIMDVTESEVINTFSTSQVTRIIHGHTHRPNLHRIEADDSNSTVAWERWVLGDWYQKEDVSVNISYIKATPSSVELVSGEKSWVSS